MKKNVLIINSAIAHLHANGQLNNTLIDIAKQTLESLGHIVKITKIVDEYNPLNEMEKFKWADIIIYQFPAWWMSFPWQLKKYIDEIFLQGIAYETDGRTRSNLNKKYGSDGLFNSKLYMLSATWNAPLSAFEDKDDFFGGVGVDNVYLHFHKLNQFIGMKPLPTFLLNDVIKNPNIELFKKKYIAHLLNLFK